MAAALFEPKSAMAFGKLEDANTKLTTYNLPPIIFVPPGFSPLVSEFGRGNIKEKMVNPLLVQFCHPQLWVEAVTSYNNNGEAGTISANDYIKGDSSFFFFRPLAEGTTLTVGSKEVIKEFLLKSLSQKGDPVETFKLVSLKQGNKGVDGQVILNPANVIYHWLSLYFKSLNFKYYYDVCCCRTISLQKLRTQLTRKQGS